MSTTAILTFPLRFLRRLRVISTRLFPILIVFSLCLTPAGGMVEAAVAAGETPRSEAAPFWDAAPPAHPIIPTMREPYPPSSFNYPIPAPAYPPVMAPARQQPHLMAAANGTIHGRVVDTQGQPIANLPISLDGPGYGDGTCTDANGEYTFNAAMDVAWRVRAAPVGNNWCGGPANYAQVYWSNQILWDNAGLITLTAENSARSDINFTLTPGQGGAISGHIFQEDGVTPIADACIAVENTNGQHIGSWGRTESDGSFTIGHIPAVPVIVRTHVSCGSVTGFQEEYYAGAASTPDSNAAQPVQIVAGQTTSGINFQLDEVGLIRGRVTDQQGKPLANIHVHAMAPFVGQGVCTNVNGEYSINADYGTNWRVRASADNKWCGGPTNYALKYYDNGFSWDNANIIVLTPQDRVRDNVNFSLGQGGAISGHIYRADGKTPVANACLRVNQWVNGAPDGWTTSFERTGADGSFLITALPPGPFAIQTEVRCGGENLDLVEEWFRVTGSTPDRKKAEPVTVTAGKTVGGVNFQLDLGGSISGKATQKGSGAPVTRGEVHAYDTQFDWVGWTGLGSDGTYRITGLPAGQFYLAIHPQGFGGVYYPNAYDDTGAQLITVKVGENVPNINFTLSPEATVSGKVLKSDGVTAISGAKVMVWPWNGGQTREGFTASDGTFTVGGLSTGSYVARAQADGYESEYYLDTESWMLSKPISVTQPNNTPGINFTLSVPQPPPDSEVIALNTLHMLTNGPSWFHQEGWTTNSNPCTWDGVVCHDGHVQALYLSYNNLSGQIPAAIGSFPQLQLLFLDGNSLSGLIRAEIGNLKELRMLYLSDNRLTGAVPPSLTNLTKLYDPGQGPWGRPGLMLGYNRLDVPAPSNPPTALEKFLNAKDPNWALTQAREQRIAPSGGELESRDGTTTVSFPAGSISNETEFVFAPVDHPRQSWGSLAFANTSFQINALDANGQPLEDYTFKQPVRLSLKYEDSDVTDIDESLLKLYYWDTTAQAWADAATSCNPPSLYQRDLTANSLTVNICHLSDFALFGIAKNQVKQLYLPAVRR